MEFSNVNLDVKKKQGDLGVARAIYEYTRLGYTVLAPLSDSSKYDLVIDDGTTLKRVQVKTSRFKPTHKSGNKSTGYMVNLATKGGNTKINTVRSREDNDYDVLFVLVESGECWSIPTDKLNSRTSINVGATGERAGYLEYKL